MSDIRAQQAREHHQMAGDLEAQAARHRAARDRLIRELRAEDPELWTLRQLGSAVGCTFQLIEYILRRAGES